MSLNRTHLKRLLQPQSIAVIGGGAWAENVVRECKEIGFAGPIWPVHPSRPNLSGVPCYPSIETLPGAPDAVFIGINRTSTIGALKELSRLGAGGAVCFASGFAEAENEMSGSQQLQRDLISAAGDMAILGPNCYGFINYLDGAALWPDQHGGLRHDSGAALITQSSNIAINLTMQTRGLPLSYVITTGNQAQQDMADIAMEVLRDPRVTCLGLHIEGIKNINTLHGLAKLSHELKKPIVALKIGLSDAAQTATQSHTASLAGSAAGALALFDHLGFASTDSLSEMLEILKIWHVLGPLAGKRIATASCSGGEASLAADTAQRAGLVMPPLTEKQASDLRDALGPAVALSNPLDYHTYIWPDTNAMARTYTSLFDGPLDLGIVIADFPRPDRCDARDWDSVVHALMQTRGAVSTKLALLATLPETLPEPVAEKLISAGIVPLTDMPVAFSAITKATASARAPSPVWPPRPTQVRQTLTEDRAKPILQDYGISVPNAFSATSLQDIEDNCSTLNLPVVLKGLGHAHKSEHGAVAVNLKTTHDVCNAAQRINSASYLIEEMVQNTIFEALIGITLDPAHGYCLTFGAGGTRTELHQDTITMMLPLDRDRFEQNVRQLKHAPVLYGYRGARACNFDAIWQTVQNLQTYIEQNIGHVIEVEINPLICTATAVIAVDALIVLGEPVNDTGAD